MPKQNNLSQWNWHGYFFRFQKLEKSWIRTISEFRSLQKIFPKIKVEARLHWLHRLHWMRRRFKQLLEKSCKNEICETTCIRIWIRLCGVCVIFLLLPLKGTLHQIKMLILEVYRIAVCILIEVANVRHITHSMTPRKPQFIETTHLLLLLKYTQIKIKSWCWFLEPVL